MPRNRRTPAASVCANDVAAGSIASSSGNAMVAPAPRRKVRRGRLFLVMNIYLSSGSAFVRI
jgi:hypothetical protein